MALKFAAGAARVNAGGLLDLVLIEAVEPPHVGPVWVLGLPLRSPTPRVRRRSRRPERALPRRPPRRLLVGSGARCCVRRRAALREDGDV